MAVVAVAGCGSASGTASHASPSPAVPSASSSPTDSGTPPASPSPSPSPSPALTPTAVPAWAALHASCSGTTTSQEALITLQHSTAQPVLADVTDPVHPRTICTISGSWTPQLVTQGMVSWTATQGSPGTPGQTVIATLDMFTGTTVVVASWTGGGFDDGLHSWSPDLSTLVYVTSDANAVNVHLLSGGGDRVITTFGGVPGRGQNPNEDDAFLGFSPDGGYFALEQTFTGSGDHLDVWSRAGLVFSQTNATMATWGSTGSKLFFRQPNASVIYLWDSSGPAGNRSQAFGQQSAWIRPHADAGDDYIAYTVRDSSGTPHVWLYGHGGRAGGQLPNQRSTPAFLNSGTIFVVEEAPCGANCGIGPTTQPDGKTFTYSIATQTETPSTIASVIGVWPRPGQV